MSVADMLSEIILEIFSEELAQINQPLKAPIFLIPNGPNGLG